MKKTANVERRTSNVEGGLLLLLLILLLLAFSFKAQAQTSPDLIAASQPLADGIPQVAVVRLRELLSGELSPEQRTAATVKLGEALVAADEPAEALKIFAEPAVRDLPESRFLRAQALAALGRWGEALPLYQQTATDGASPHRLEAMFGQAEALRSLRRLDDAIEIFRSLERDRRWTTRSRVRAVELLIEKGEPRSATRLLAAVEPRTAAERKERRLLRGRIAAAENKLEEAVELLGSILRRPEGATHAVLLSTLLAMAEVHLQLGTPGRGADHIEEFIERRPADRALPRLFAKLDQLYAAERRQSRHELGRWTRDTAQPRRALAQWYLARAELRLGRREVALQTLERLRVSHPPYAPLVEAFLDYARLAQEEGKFEAALTSLEAARALDPAAEMRERIEMLAATIQYQAGRFAVAAQGFSRIAQPSSAYAKTALFNSSLAWLQAGDAAQAAAASDELKKSGGDKEARGDLLLERGLVAAARGSADSTSLLHEFLRVFPKHTRAAEAWVALAELAFHAAPPRIDEAREQVTRAAESQPTPVAKERAAYLMIWLEDAAPARDELKVIGLAEQFLREHSGSALLPEVRLKLAETHYGRQDFASAQTHFEILGQRSANSALAEKALFFAGQSAWQSMGQDSLSRALVLFDEVVRRNGELKWAARNEQAMLERKLGKPQDALTFYEEVLRGEAGESEKREALCGKADVFYELGPADAGNYKRAMELYEELASEREVPPHWRNQALFKKGMCLEKLSAPGEALATFYRIIEEDALPPKQREFFWFYKAGFNAARLLEEQSKWQPAAAVYEKLAFAGGGRSEEARARLNRLRLEHFLWEQ